jgi:pimeloyl-ACP methyl ester carboxylesterase
MHDFGGPWGLMWAAAHPDAFASATLVNTGVLLDYRWHHYAKVWRTPGLGELFQATTTRPAFRMLIGRENPRLSRRARTASTTCRSPGRRSAPCSSSRHWPFLEDPGRVNEQVIPFLREVTAAST